jgi:predicted nucleic acid-binding protein
MRLLLDVNVWIALFDEAHVFAGQAAALMETPGIKIATCPLVENGVIRVLNVPAYARIGPIGFERVRAQLGRHWIMNFGRMTSACATMSSISRGSLATIKSPTPICSR